MTNNRPQVPKLLFPKEGDSPRLLTPKNSPSPVNTRPRTELGSLTQQEHTTKLEALQLQYISSVEKERLQLVNLKKEISDLISKETKHLITILRDEINLLYQVTEEQRVEQEKKQKELIEQQFDWFKSDIDGSWKEALDARQSSLETSAREHIHVHMDKYQDYMANKLAGDLKMVRHQLSEEINDRVKMNSTVVELHVKNEMDALERRLYEQQKKNTHNDIVQIKDRLAEVEKQLQTERKEKEAIEEDFQNLQKEFQRFINLHPSDKYHSDFMYQPRYHTRTSLEKTHATQVESGEKVTEEEP